MDLFRRKQKLIFWIVTIIIVPSFVLVWGAGGLGGGNSGQEFEMGTVDGKTVSYTEFEAFQKRIRAALGGIPFQFANAPGSGTPAEEAYKFLFAYQMLRDAEKAGIRVSDLQVGTYLETGHPTIAPAIRADDPQSKDRAVDALCRQMQVSRQEFLQGIRDWQLIGNYVDSDAGLAAVNDEMIYTYYALNKSQLTLRRVRFVESEAIKNEAKAEIMAKPKEELDREVSDYIASHIDQIRYREPARWRFAYVFSPNLPADSVTQPIESEIQARYDADKSRLYGNAPLPEVRDRIFAELLKEEVERQTLRNFTVDIDAQLRGKGADLSLDELGKLTQLVKYGVVARETAPEAIPTTEALKALPAGGQQLQQLLDSVETASPAARDEIVKEWKKGWDMTDRPFKSDDGFFRLRLLDYVASRPADPEADGSIKPEFYEKAIEDMVGARANEKVLAEVTKVEEKLHAYFAAKEKGEAAPDQEFATEFEALMPLTLSYLNITDNLYELGRLPIGDMTGPQPYSDPTSGESGQELVVVVDRRVPSRETFNAEPEDQKAMFRQIAQTNYQGNYGFTYTENGPAAIIQPSPAIMAGLADKFNRGELRVNPELLREQNG